MADEPTWNYLLVFNDDVGTMEQVKEFLNSRSEILTWYFCLTHAIFIRSSYTASTLQRVFREFTKDKARFIILDCKTDRNGWLPRHAWEFMKDEYP